MAKLKVFGGLVMTPKGQLRTIVAATSRAKACEILCGGGIWISLSHITNFWSVTHNESEVTTAMSRPGTIFQAQEKFSRTYIEIGAK